MRNNKATMINNNNNNLYASVHEFLFQVVKFATTAIIALKTVPEDQCMR